MDIKLVVLDIAGTTVDENNIVYKTLQKVINNAGYKVQLDEVLMKGAGKEKYNAIIDIIKNEEYPVNSMDAKRIHSDFKIALAEAYTSFLIKPQPGVMDLFHYFKKNNIKAVLNTGYDRQTAISIINKLNWVIGETFDGLVTASDVNRNRPFPDMIFLAMQQFGITDPNKLVKVGDSCIDIEEGKNAGCALSVGITTGAQTAPQLLKANPDAIITHLNELLPLIQ